MPGNVTPLPLSNDLLRYMADANAWLARLEPPSEAFDNAASLDTLQHIIDAIADREKPSSPGEIHTALVRALILVDSHVFTRASDDTITLVADDVARTYAEGLRYFQHKNINTDHTL